jgi:uncharacterized DUF497 family protein
MLILSPFPEGTFWQALPWLRKVPTASPLDREGKLSGQICTDVAVVEFEWDPEKAATNFRKRGRLADAATIFDNDALPTMADEHPDEERFVAGGSFRINSCCVYPPSDRIRITFACEATRAERKQYEERK